MGWDKHSKTCQSKVFLTIKKNEQTLLFCRTLPFRIYFAYSDHKIQRGATLLEHEKDKTLGVFLDEIFPNIDASVVNSKKLNRKFF